MKTILFLSRHASRILPASNSVAPSNTARMGTRWMFAPPSSKASLLCGTRANSSKSAMNAMVRREWTAARHHPFANPKNCGRTRTPKFKIIATKVAGGQFSVTSGLEQPSIRECRASHHLERTREAANDHSHP
jgi:hypothetical protein